MTSYQLSALEEARNTLLICMAIGVTYFLVHAGPLRERLVVASPSLVLVTAFAYALAVSPWSENRVHTLVVPFYGLLAAYLFATISCLVRFKGHRAIHALHLVQVPCAFYLWILGVMTIAHDWI